jgi:gluconolactonase
MKILRVAALVGAALIYGQQVQGQDYALGLDSQAQSGVPKGTVTRYELASGKFFRGTPHTYSIYVPAQYEATKPAPFMIFLDGGAFLLDSVRVPRCSTISLPSMNCRRCLVFS